MYVPKHFEARDDAAMFDVIEAHALAVLVVTLEGRAEATHVPVVLDRGRGAHGTLRFHLAGANPTAGVLDGTPALLVFNGPQTYVSPDWYATPHMVPTWNYIAVHAYGAPARMDDGALHALLVDLSAVNEAGLPKVPWTVDKVPADRYAAMRRAIVGFEMPVERLEGKWKLNQNRAAEDRAGVAAALRAVGGEDREAIAAAMEAVDGE